MRFPLNFINIDVQNTERTHKSWHWFFFKLRFFFLFSFSIKNNNNRSPASAVRYQCAWFQLHVVLASSQLQFQRSCCWWLVSKIATLQLVAQLVHWVTLQRQHMLRLPRLMHIWHPTSGRIFHLVNHHTKNMPISWPSTINQAKLVHVLKLKICFTNIQKYTHTHTNKYLIKEKSTLNIL